jgi:glutamate-1-semialdehyde 2,1-aminomutase
VTPYIKKNYKVNNFTDNKNFSNLRLTLDEPEDFEVLKNIYKYFKNKKNFSYNDILKLYKKKPKIFQLNSHIGRDEGSNMNNGQKLWKRAKNIIPSGNMFLSKNSDTFLPKFWPSYFSRAKGVNVWDLNNKKYIDASLMSVGTNILGYANTRVDNKVKKAIGNSVSSTLNCPEEVELCEKLVSMHKWSDMARLARTGGEINAVAVRLARAYTGKDKIAICGYHGWHDWYLSTNLKNKQNLDQHLLSNLKTEGVPKFLKNSVFQFSYNKINQLKKILSENKDVGTIKIEVSRNEKANISFLKEIRNIANKNNIVLIFDECTSGFRETFGGLHLKYDISPDMATFGKSLGNGYAITALIGKKDIMDKSLDSFISSTFWSERIGPVAALETLKVMEETKSWKKISLLGNIIKSKWHRLIKMYDIDASIKGLSALPIILFNKHNLNYKTLITQEMLKVNFLASNSFYTSISHNEKIIEKYFYHLDKVFKKINICNIENNPNKFIEGEVCKSNISRIN